MTKKMFCMILAICMVLLFLAGCLSVGTKNAVHKRKFQAIVGKVIKVDDMLYEVTYDDYSPEVPGNSAFDDLAGDMGCSSVRNGNFVGRNFDYFMNQCPTFVVRTTAKEDRYATIGVGRLAKVNSAMVAGGLPLEKIELLPWIILDGMNEKGLVANSNVTLKADWGDIPHTGTNPGAPELNAIFVVRTVLDKCATADEAISYLKMQNITPMDSSKFDLHFMISDPGKTYVVEFINNEVVVQEQYLMTNYFVNIGKIPEHPEGLERMRILKENYDEGNSMDGMYHLMQRVRYTNSNYAANRWYSESGLAYSLFENPGKEVDEALEQREKEFEQEKEYVEKNGLREKTEWWDTAHNTIYDIESKKIWVTVHERYEEGPHVFGMKSESAANEYQ